MPAVRRRTAARPSARGYRPPQRARPRWLVAASRSRARFTAPATSMASVTSQRVARSSRTRPLPGAGCPWRSRASPECRYTACGITVAPSIAVASNALSVPSNRGIRPVATSPGGGGLTTSPARKPMVMISRRPEMMRSNTLWPLRSPMASKSSDTNPVIAPPSTSGRPNNSCRAIAPPMISATSVAMAMSSACSQ